MENDKFDLDIYGGDASQDNGGETNDQQNNAGSSATASISANSNAQLDGSTTQIQQGTKRKELPDDRAIDQNAALAIVISDLHWWITDDDVRGWAREANCEEELKDLSFNEHKVNGKSKGQVYLEFASLQASTAVKHAVDAMGVEKSSNKFSTVYHHAPNNPYRTLPKDVPGRGHQRNNMGMHGNNSPATSNFNSQGSTGHNFNGFRSGRGGFNNNNNNNMRGGFQNRQFNQNMNHSGFPNMFGGGGGMGQPQMNNYQNFNRGGMMNPMGRGGMAPRGGRGGMMGGMMNPMMGSMPVPMNMPMGMGMMNQMMGGPMPMNNPNFYQQGPGGPNQNQNEGNWNPHGAKRPRPE